MRVVDTGDARGAGSGAQVPVVIPSDHDFRHPGHGRRESVAPYTGRLIRQVGAPVVDQITGLPPAVALQQSRGTPGRRSTVGTVPTPSRAPSGGPVRDDDAGASR